MESISAEELNRHTSTVIARVANGESLKITVDGRPVAMLVPVRRTGELDDLIADGRVIPATDHSPFPMPPVLGDPSVSVSDELIKMREEERY